MEIVLRLIEILALALIALSTSTAATSQHARPWMNATLSPDRRAELLTAAMTDAEKQTLTFGYFASTLGPDQPKPPEGSRAGSAGYVPGIPRLGIPPQWQTDAGVGVATQGAAAVKRERTALPSGLATAATWDPDIAFEGGAMIGDEARRSGFNVMLAGGVDLMREPRNGRNFEYAGEDPLLAGRIVGAQIAGIQSNRIIATVKHFALNDQETDRQGSGDSAIDRAAARMSDLLAFQFAIEAGNPGAVMCAYNRVNGPWACESPWLLTDVLRRDWRYPGFVMSDWGAVHSTVASANAGLEQDSGAPFDDKPYFGPPLAAAIREGAVTHARLDQMARRIVRSMFAHGLLDLPISEQPIDYAAHAAVTRKDAEEGAVLLKNEGALLPLAPALRRIAVIGGHADRGVLAGGGSSLVYPRGGNAVADLKPTSWPGPVMYYPSAPLDAIRKQAPGAIVRFADGTDVAAATALARESDVAIVFGTQWAGESFDVPLMLDGDQDALIAAVAAANTRTVVVLETGGPVLASWADRVPAVLEAWYPGTEGGEAIARLLFGETAPSGRLPATFPRSLAQLPHPQAPHSGETRYSEGGAVGYKWFDKTGAVPQFAFGHGLTYTRLAYRRLRARAEGGTVRADFQVTNTGSRAGVAVAQLYVGPVGGGWEAPKRLGGWRRLALAPGASSAASVIIDPRLLATWDEGLRQWRIAAGDYRVMLADSARDIRETATVRLSARALPADWKPPTAHALH